MSDYISREEAIELLHYNADETCSAVVSDFESLPAADVKPVRHGRWGCVYDYYTGVTDITCSHCKNTRTVNGCFVSTNGKSCYFEDDYCPNCGAKMDLEDEK